MSEVYTSVTSDLIRQNVPDSANILYLLKYKPDHYFTAKKIAEILGFPSRGSCVEVRKAITELIERHGHPIVSDNHGFCYTHDKNKLVAYSNSLLLRQKGICKRRNHINLIIEEME
jgi:hypothetical protein